MSEAVKRCAQGDFTRMDKSPVIEFKNFGFKYFAQKESLTKEEE